MWKIISTRKNGNLKPATEARKRIIEIKNRYAVERSVLLALSIYFKQVHLLFNTYLSCPDMPRRQYKKNTCHSHEEDKKESPYIEIEIHAGFGIHQKRSKTQRRQGK